MVPFPEVYEFIAEYCADSPAYDEFDRFLRKEFPKESEDWQPRLGRVSRYDGKKKEYDYTFLLMGTVPGSSSRADAEKKAHRLVADLTRRFRLSHANPGSSLPEPVVAVFRIEAAA